MSYTFSGSASDSSATTTSSVTLSVGATANPKVIIALTITGGVSLSGAPLTVGGITATQDALEAEDLTEAIYSVQLTGGLSGNQTVTLGPLTGSGSNVRSFMLWYTSDNIAFNNQNSAFNATFNVSVLNGDSMFACLHSGSSGANFSSSTVAPTGDRAFTGTINNSDGADWAIAASNASFGVTPNLGSHAVAAVYRPVSTSFITVGIGGSEW